MYIIAEYDARYRPYDKSGGELRNPDWVKLPAKPRGEGLVELFDYKRGLEVFGIWCLLLEKATVEKKPENRGKLLNHKEKPATIEEIAKAISLKNKKQLVKYAISVLVEIGWVISDDNSEHTSEALPQTSSKSKVDKSKVDKSKYTELFEKFWNAFKGRWNADKSRYDKGSKLEAWEVWKKMSDTDQEKAIVGAPKSGGKFTPDCCKWLKQKRWET